MSLRIVALAVIAMLLALPAAALAGESCTPCGPLEGPEVTSLVGLRSRAEARQHLRAPVARSPLGPQAPFGGESPAPGVPAQPHTRPAVAPSLFTLHGALLS